MLFPTCTSTMTMFTSDLDDHDATNSAVSIKHGQSKSQTIGEMRKVTEA